MAKARFVLRYRGEGDKPAHDVTRIRQLPGAALVDESARMVVVESEEASLPQLAEALPPGWSIVPEPTYEVPDTRRRVTRPPG